MDERQIYYQNYHESQTPASVMNLSRTSLKSFKNRAVSTAAFPTSAKSPSSSILHASCRSIVGVGQISSLSLYISTVLLVDSFSITDSHSFSLPILHRFSWPLSVLSPDCCSFSILFLFPSLLLATFASGSVHFLYLFL